MDLTYYYQEICFLNFFFGIWFYFVAFLVLFGLDDIAGLPELPEDDATPVAVGGSKSPRRQGSKKKKSKSSVEEESTVSPSFSDTCDAKGAQDPTSTYNHHFVYDFVDQKFSGVDSSSDLIKQQVHVLHLLLVGLNQRNRECYHNLCKSARYKSDEQYRQRIDKLWLVNEKVVSPVGEFFLLAPLKIFFRALFYFV